jgi:hypothetical protein
MRYFVVLRIQKVNIYGDILSLSPFSLSYFICHLKYMYVYVRCLSDRFAFFNRQREREGIKLGGYKKINKTTKEEHIISSSVA